MKKNFLKNKKILITCGPTWVPIDDMRVISNKSSGQLGKRMAEDFFKAGGKVTVIEGPVFNPITVKKITIRKFHFFDELMGLLKKELAKKYDIVVHAAAVSDYKLKKPFKTKISSDQSQVKLDLVRTPKVINLIKKINPKVLLVGFKLETSFSANKFTDKVGKLFKEAKCDFVIANTLKGNKYCGYLIDNRDIVSVPIRSRELMSQFLVETLKDYQG